MSSPVLATGVTGGGDVAIDLWDGAQGSNVFGLDDVCGGWKVLGLCWGVSVLHVIKRAQGGGDEESEDRGALLCPGSHRSS